MTDTVEKRVFLDALPYHDEEPTHEERRLVETLIEEEILRDKSPQLEPPLPLPQVDLESASAFFAAEVSRIKAGIDKPSVLDPKRYNLDLPHIDEKTTPDDVEAAWKETLTRCRLQYEHLHLKETNLELLLRHGTDVYEETLIPMAEEREIAFRKNVEELERDVMRIHQLRKREQSDAGRALDESESLFWEYVYRNMQLRGEIAKMERQLEELTAKKNTILGSSDQMDVEK
eukprot:TRINITY_DN817_c0_g3_i1.p1 TRINITY_DN817_c0_g3~~TRINITY_DN817_c0_g3_i1.p1  ORF type:complete len:231 (-),score=74.45 TRINITY_DN817_c0_g3_i1:908-1600(-)